MHSVPLNDSYSNTRPGNSGRAVPGFRGASRGIPSKEHTPTHHIAQPSALGEKHRLVWKVPELQPQSLEIPGQIPATQRRQQQDEEGTPPATLPSPATGSRCPTYYSPRKWKGHGKTSQALHCTLEKQEANSEWPFRGTHKQDS